ncbi:HAD-IIB family hydrolase [Thalassorhabdomicrobium marinisediminis]|uniref:HAD-IIB family hydrolase n=1 Tax=Thalassorhabdomicrobium marinisediminis TaxID=2170577 RepID=UPI002491E635|nr:HAD-IIB family hydrolase [Thalassorhabdomicrobium marinisediminis]
MFICHIALGGCLTAPNVNYGVTEDTGGHITYILGAANAQAQRKDVDAVQIVTRAFEDPALGLIHAQTNQPVTQKLSIRRLWTAQRAYLSKEDLAAEVPALTRAFLDDLERAPRRPDVLHAHFADAAVLAFAARDRFGIPVIYTPHSLALSKSTATPDEPRIEAERRALCEADAVVLSSRDEAECQTAAYGRGAQARVHRVSPGVALPRLTDPTAARALLEPHLANPERPMLFAVARPVARKNLTTLAEVYARSRKLQERANLVILAGQHGDPLQANAEARAEVDRLRHILGANTLTGKVALPDRHSQADVAALYDWAARSRGLFVNLALHEPFGLTILEAASYGVPVVATQEGGPADIVDDLQHGICVPPRDHRAIEAALLELLSDAKAWDAASLAGQCNVGRYDWAHWADDVQAIYAETRPATPLHAPTLMLASDIDNTLTGCAASAERFGAWLKGSGALFAVASGRSLSEARRVLRQWKLPTPQVFITSVGTEIYAPDAQGRLALDNDFAMRLDAGWDRAAVERALHRFGLTWQPKVEQRQWKLSGYGTAWDAARLQRYLGKRSIAARVVPSHGRFIDVLPRAAGKAQAIKAVARRMQIPLSQVVVAGDSGNDLDMLQAAQAGHGRGIVVGNAMDELRRALGSQGVYMSDAHHAAGVLEGLGAFGYAPDAMDPAVQVAAQ